MEGGRNPIRISCDSHLRTPLDSNIALTAKDIRTILVTLNPDPIYHKPYLNKFFEVLVVGPKNGRIDLLQLIEKLGEMNIDSIFLEGGATLNFSALESKIVHKVQCYIAPKIFGGTMAKTGVGGLGFEDITHTIKLKTCKALALGEDFLIESEVDYSCLQA